MKKLGITPKLTLIFILFAGAVLVGLGIPAYNNGRAALEGASVSELLTTAIEKQAALDNWVADRQHSMGDIANQGRLRETVAALIAAEPGSPDAGRAYADLVADLENWAGEGHRFLSMEVIHAATGRVIAATDALEKGKFREEQPYFINGLQAPYVQNPYYDLSRQRPSMTAAAPVLSPDGRVIAVLAGPLDMDEMNAIIQRRSGLHQTDDAFLVNTSNLFVTQPRLNLDPAVLQRGVHTEAVNRCLAHNSGVTAALDYRHVPGFIVYRWLPERQLCLIVKLDQAEALAPSRVLASTMALTGGLVLLVGSIMAFGMSRTITRPVRALQAGATRFGQGDLDYRIKVGARDEIGQLAGAMNDMAANLHQSLGQTAHGQRMLFALSQAAQAVQRAQTPEQVYQTVGDEVTRLGYHAMAFTVVDDRTHLALAHLTFNSAAIQAVEKVAGLSAQGFRFPIVPGGVHDQIITSGQTIFFEQAAIPLAESLPQPLHSLAGRITSLFGVKQAIYAPLAMGGKTEGLLMVTGDGLTEADAPAITAFASQTAIALENARLYQETRAWAEELEKRVEERTVALRASEEKYRNLFENAQVGMFRTKLDGSAILDVNQNLLDIFGYTREEMIASPATMRWAYPEEREKMARRLRAAGVVTNLEVAFITKTGKIRDFLISVKIYPEQGVLEGTGLDVTERKRAEDALQAAKEYAENLVETANALVVVLDSQGNIQTYNQAAEAITGYTKSDMAGKNWFEVIVPRHRFPEVWTEFERLTAGNLPRHFENPILTKAGEERFISWSNSEVVEHGRVVGVISFGQDITERRLAEEKLNIAIDDLARSNAELERFAYVASHDLQEPLRMVTSYLQLLERRYKARLDGDALEFINYAVDGSNRMKTLINDLLAFSRVGTRRKEFVLTDCEEILGYVLSTLQISIEESRGKVTHDPLPKVMADKAQLESLFQNLIGNAVKFHGKNPPKIHVGVKKDDKNWIFSVSDNGIGVDPQYFERIFIIFQRLHTREDYPGTGIGLAISKRIIERHGGRMWIESQPEKGSTFFFTLPIRGESQ